MGYTSLLSVWDIPAYCQCGIYQLIVSEHSIHHIPLLTLTCTLWDRTPPFLLAYPLECVIVVVFILQLQLEKERKERLKQKEKERKLRRKQEGKPITKKEKEAESRRLAQLEVLQMQGLWRC